MTIAVMANKLQWEELKPLPEEVEWLHIIEEQMFFTRTKADLFINLLENAAEMDYSAIAKPVLINSVTTTLKEMKAPDNVLRINGWNSFIARSNWEVAGKMNEAIAQLFSLLKKDHTIVADEPGLIAARIIVMIINEAYFALEDNVSTKPAIDIAMRLGTNYPHGPFEWSEKIGIKNIYALLQRLSITDNRYLPSNLLQQEVIA